MRQIISVTLCISSIFIVLILPVVAVTHTNIESPISTFSIVAYDPEVQEWGVAVQSKFLAVGSVVPFAAADGGAVATQAWGNMTYGPEGLKLLGEGTDAETVVATLTEKDKGKEYRQLGVVDKNGVAAAFTGNECQFWAGHKVGKNYCVQGNILTGKPVIDAMAKAFETTKGSLAERMLAALSAGQDAGGDSRGRQSAALLVARLGGGYSGFSDIAVDLRVDDHELPITELKRIHRLYLKTFGIMSNMNSYSAYKQTQRNEIATKCLTRGLELAERTPDLEPPTLNAVAWTLAENNTEMERALKLAQLAVDGAPDDPNIIDTLATIHFLLGNRDQAIELEQMAIALSMDKTLFQQKLDKWQGKTTGTSVPEISEPETGETIEEPDPENNDSMVAPAPH